MTDHIVAPADEIDDGERILVELEGREIGIFRTNGQFHALLNWCPHQGGPLCKGGCTGRQRAEYDRETRRVEFEWTDEGEILTCPWHDWEFDIKTGENIPREDIKIPKYPVRIEEGSLVVDV